jgi:hypothetical protein
VDDRRPIAKPVSPAYSKTLYSTDAYLTRRLPRALELPGTVRARGINSLGEVPDSSWFQNRIGRHPMSVAQVRRGPNRGESPEAHRPWIIHSSKVGGASVGFIIEDRRGIKYVLKFDEKKVPLMETAAGIIVQRILHACGYNVPEDDIVHLRRGDLRLAPGAVVKDTFGDERPMTPEDLESRLAQVHVGRDGRIRAMVSRFLPGELLGGIAMEGTRADDPNDLIPHEQRREMRGKQPIFAWLNHIDVKEANSLDVWVPRTPGGKLGHVVHYLLDFGKALGVMGHIHGFRQAGWTHANDIHYTLLTLPTLGLWTRPWERLRHPRVPAIGLYTAEPYDPGRFVPSMPYYPFADADRFDNFWGAKILIRFTREQIRGIVEEARYPDPRSSDYLTNVLISRQRKTARYWFGRVTPLDDFRVEPAGPSLRLCFDDLMVRYALDEEARIARYPARAFDYHGRPTGWATETGPDRRGRACLAGLELAGPHHGYTIVRITPRRAGRPLPPLEIHLARAPDSGSPRVIGLRRY